MQYVSFFRDAGQYDISFANVFSFLQCHAVPSADYKREHAASFCPQCHRISFGEQSHDIGKKQVIR